MATTKRETEEPPENVVKQWYGMVGSENWGGMPDLMTPDFQNHYAPFD